MTTYYFKNPEEALKRAKAAGKQPGCWYGGIILPNGKRGWMIYKGVVGFSDKMLWFDVEKGIRRGTISNKRKNNGIPEHIHSDCKIIYKDYCPC